MSRIKKGLGVTANTDYLLLSKKSQHFILAIKGVSKKTNLANLYLRYIFKRKVNYLNLKVIVEPQWLDGHWLDTNVTPIQVQYEVAVIVKKLDDFITSYLEENGTLPEFNILKEFSEGKVKTAKEAIRKIENNNFDFFTIKDKCLKQQFASKQITKSTLSLYNTYYNVFKRFLLYKGLDTITVTQINNLQFLKEFEEYLFSYKSYQVKFLESKGLDKETIFDDRLRNEFDKYLSKIEEREYSKTATVNNILNSVIKILQYSFDIDVLDNETFKKYKVPTIKQKEIVAFQQEDIQYIKSLNFFSNRTLRNFKIIVLAAFYSGLRSSELWELSSDNIFIDENNPKNCYLKGKDIKNKTTFFRPLTGDGLVFFKKLKEETKDKSKCFKKLYTAQTSVYLKRLLENYDKQIMYGGELVYFKDVVKFHDLRKGRITEDVKIYGSDVAKRISGHKSRAFDRYVDIHREKDILDMFHAKMDTVITAKPADIQDNKIDLSSLSKEDLLKILVTVINK
jgi:integrase